MRGRKKRLSSFLFVFPILSTFMMFLLIFFSFQFIMNRYIEKNTEKSIQNEFQKMDSLFEEKSGFYGEEADSFSFDRTVKYAILGEDGKSVFTFDDWYQREKKEKKITEQISERIFKNIEKEKQRSIKLKIDNRIFSVGVKSYFGVYLDGIISKAFDGETAKLYFMLVYLDITSEERLLRTMNQSLVWILCLIGGLSLLLLFKNLKEIQSSFSKMDSYLVKIGRREKLSEEPNFAFQEFSNIVETIREMSNKIDESERVQKQFFQNASHELRTPLMSIQGYAEGLKEGVLKDSKKASDIILEESKRMSALVDEILFLSKFEAMEPKKESLSLKNLLFECGNRTYVEAKHSHIELIWDISEDFYVVGDENLLERLFGNILSNALRYAKKKIHIFAKDFGEQVEIHILNDGEPIADEDLPHIFERFYKGRGGNFGIGLSMASEIAKKHGGRLQVVSDEKGTDFFVKLDKVF